MTRPPSYPAYPVPVVTVVIVNAQGQVWVEDRLGAHCLPSQAFEGGATWVGTVTAVVKTLTGCAPEPGAVALVDLTTDPLGAVFACRVGAAVAGGRAGWIDRKEAGQRLGTSQREHLRRVLSSIQV